MGKRQVVCCSVQSMYAVIVGLTMGLAMFIKVVSLFASDVLGTEAQILTR